MTILARPSEWARTSNATASSAPIANGSHHYFAFLSYSHRNQAIADWLHQALERFVVPSHLVGRITDHGAVPKRLTPIFRDLNELPASDDLGGEIRAAIAGSRFLIVLCSPAAARSRWTNAEIEVFRRVRPDGCIFAAIVDGEPFASDLPGREDEECLPKALRFKYDRRGRQTINKAEPLAADLRGGGEARRLGFLKLVSGMLGLGLDELVQRDTIRRQRRLAAVAGSSLVGMLIATGLAVTAIQARDEARDQRREAEGLVGFMLGDLRAKLEPIGRLDALDGVGSRVLAYYQKLGTSDLSDASLMQRSKALALMAEVANSRGDLDGATRLYREAMAGTAEAIRRDPSDPQRLYDHAQNVFWTADIALRKGETAAAEAALREYKRLADRMVALEPDNMQWRMEVHNADANLGSILFKQRRYPEASRQFERALNMVQAIATVDPGNRAYQDSLTEAMAWMADAHLAEGRLDEAIAVRERNVALLERLLKRSGDVDWAYKLIPAHRTLGNLYVWRGRPDEGVRQMQEASTHAEELLAVEPGNSKWVEFAARARINLADVLLASGKVSDAAAYARTGCGYVQSLVRRGENIAAWAALRRDCLLTRTSLALASGTETDALSTASQALESAKSAKASDPTTKAYSVARAYRLIGDAHRSLGNADAARAAWARALAILPHPTAERPFEMSERRMILQRLGRTEAQQLAKRLSAIGYQEPEFKKL